MADSTLSILFDLFAVGQKTRVLLAEAMAESPLTPTEYAVYSLVFDLGRVTPTDMAETMGLPVTTLLDYLHEMEANGHLSRSPNPRDGRSYLVSLTDDGLEAHREAGENFNQAMSRILEHLEADPEEVRRMLNALGDASQAALGHLRDSLARADLN